MISKAVIFEKTYKDYIARIAGIDLGSIEQKLGVHAEGNDDADDEFPAQSSVFFERRAEKYLDPECLAMAGRLLFTLLKEV